jgi:hypothetical protein
MYVALQGSELLCADPRTITVVGQPLVALVSVVLGLFRTPVGLQLTQRPRRQRSTPIATS